MSLHEACYQGELEIVPEHLRASADPNSQADGPSEPGSAALEDRLRSSVQRSPRLMQVLRTIRALDLPDWRVFSGAIYQTAWNSVTGRHCDYGVRDYDLAYYDAFDLSYDAEDLVIRRVATAFEPPLREMVEVRNQARVHLWFERKSASRIPRSRAPTTRSGASCAPRSPSAYGWSATIRSASRRPSGWKTPSRCSCVRILPGPSPAHGSTPPRAPESAGRRQRSSRECTLDGARHDDERISLLDILSHDDHRQPMTFSKTLSLVGES